MPDTGNMDTSNYPNKDSIGKAVVKGVKDYQSHVKQGKNMPDTRVKRVFVRKSQKKGGK